MNICCWIILECQDSGNKTADSSSDSVALIIVIGCDGNDQTKRKCQLLLWLFSRRVREPNFDYKPPNLAGDCIEPEMWVGIAQTDEANKTDAFDATEYRDLNPIH